MSQMLTKGGVCSRYYFISEIRRNQHRQLSLPSCPEALTIPKISVNPPPGVFVCVCCKHHRYVCISVHWALLFFSLSLKST